MTPNSDDENSREGIDEHALQRFSDVLQTYKLKKLVSRQAARETLALIDAVHGVAGLPLIPITCTTVAGQFSSSFCFRPTHETGEIEYPSIRLLVSNSGAGQLRLMASLLHEFGHAIDMLAFRNRAQIFCSETHSVWNDWRRSVMYSEYVTQLTRSALRPPRRPGIEPPELDYLFEAMAWRNRQFNELWARSYAQYIAVRNNHPALLATLREIRDIPDDNFPDHSVPRQWTDDDFVPILESIDQLFGCLQWRHS